MREPGEEIHISELSSLLATLNKMRVGINNPSEDILKVKNGKLFLVDVTDSEKTYEHKPVWIPTLRKWIARE